MTTTTTATTTTIIPPSNNDEHNNMVSLIDSPFDQHHSLLLPSSSTDKPSSKKPRHRHTQPQLAALNKLYDKSEHPSLEERSSLADALGMYVLSSLLSLSHPNTSFRETKTVNAWFQNKRASLKKRTRTAHPTSSSLSSPPIVLPSTASNSLRNSSKKSDLDEFHEYDPLRHHPAPLSTSILHPPTTPPPSSSSSSFYPGDLTHPSDAFVDPEATPRRFRPSPDQTEELRKLYNTTVHPTRDEREELGARIGM
jgi:hypothetical protein